MPTATRGEASIEIQASAERIYDVITDITSIGERSPECYRAEWLDGISEAQVGARFVGYSRLGLLKWSTTSVVTAADRGNEFAFTVLAGDRESTKWRYLIDSTGDGATLTETYQFLWCPLYSRIAEIPIPRDRQLSRGIARTIAHVKSRSEAPIAP